MGQVLKYSASEALNAESCNTLYKKEKIMTRIKIQYSEALNAKS